jgi:hypothetical protein
MNKYIFLTTEGFTYQPNSESCEPDIENMQVIGFGQGNMVQEALGNLLEINEDLGNTSFDEVLAIQLANDQVEYLSLKQIVKGAKPA